MKTAIIVFGNQPGVMQTIESLLAAADSLGTKEDGEVWLLGGEEVLDASLLQSVPYDQIIWMANSSLDDYVPRQWLETSVALYEKNKPDAILLPATMAGNQLAVELGTFLQSGSITDVCRLELEKDRVIVEKPVYSMNLRGVFTIVGKPVITSVTEGNYEPAQSSEGHHARVTICRDLTHTQNEDWFRDVEIEKLEQQKGIRTASTVIVAGRGVRSKERIPVLEKLARAMDGSLGGTRPVILDGWLPLDRMIGASAAMIHPEKCIVFGASGAAPFLVGVEKSQLLVGINKDFEAPLFQACNVGVVEDCQSMLEALLELFNNGSGRNKWT